MEGSKVRLPPASSNTTGEVSPENGRVVVVTTAVAAAAPPAQKEEGQPQPPPPTPNLTGKDDTMFLKPLCVIEAVAAPTNPPNAAAADAVIALAAAGEGGERLMILEGLLDPRDSFADIIRYIQKGRIHTVSFVKNLPNTSKGIQQGKIDHDRLAVKLADIVFEQENEKDHPDMMIFLPPFSKIVVEDPFIYVGLVLANYAIPAGWFRRQEKKKGGGVSGDEDLQKKLCVGFGNILCKKFSDLTVFQPFYVKMFRRCCVEYADVIDREVFNGIRGCFIRQCPLLLNPHRVVTLTGPANDLVFKFLGVWQQLTAAGKDAKRGIHESEHSCWECGAQCSSSRTASCCGGCRLAAYCSSTCQSKAWKGGHKLKCALLQKEYQACEESYKVIETLHNEKQHGGIYSPPLYHGIILNHEIDCDLASFQHSHPRKMFELGVPSMKTYYENLGKVAKGEWWLWPRSETGSLDQYKANLANEGDDQFYFHMLANSLFYPVTDTEAYSKWVEFVEQTEGNNALMPAERFLEIYKESSLSVTSNAPDERSIRYRRYKSLVLHNLQDCCHK